jgi:2-polyprenyl-3-methyl-5-hydroxy-6-metoxy-1,4-benzoquinol methylase
LEQSIERYYSPRQHLDDEMNDPVAAYFEKLPKLHKGQFVQRTSGASFYFQNRLTLTCELAAASAGRLLDCAAGTGEITCALLESGRFSHATVVDISPAMLQSARELLSSQITNTELEFVHSDVFNFKPSDSAFDLILCLGLIAHVGRLDMLLPHLKSMLAPAGRIILQTTLTDHVGTRIVRALTARRELARRGYRISWFSQRDVADACNDAGLRIVEMRRHSLGIPFGDRCWPWANFQLETRLQKWARRHGADAIYLLGQN